MSGVTNAEAPLEEKPSYVIFHETVETLGLYDLVDEPRRRHISIYFSTKSSFRSLVEQGIATSRTEAGYLINTGLEVIFEHLPPELQEHYQSPRAIMELKTQSFGHSQQTRNRMSETRKGKSISPQTQEHKDHIRDALRNYWKQRHGKQPSEPGPQAAEHIIFPSTPEQL